MQKLTVDLGERSYPIYIGPGTLDHHDLLIDCLKGQQVCIVTNETIAPLYLDKVMSAFSSLYTDTVVLPDGESYKTLDTVNRVFDTLLSKRHNRTTTLVALGGGVIGDMTGFAAACYQRGVDFIQIPTTLLSQVDSSVGGKTGVNHSSGKNMIGAFHQPTRVVIDTHVLSTLPEREFYAGLAEVIKYGLIIDHEFFVWLENHMDDLLNRDQEALSYAIERSCQLKADVVAQDEKEGGIRAILNLGHTFGHAIEAGLGYGQWLHGEAVAAGMVMAAVLSQKLNWLSESDTERVIALLRRASLPVNAPKELSAEQFLAYMSVDKKVVDGRLRLVLLKSLGNAVIESGVSHQDIEATVQRCQ